MATAMRVECHEERDGFGGKSNGNEGGNNQLAMGACDKGRAADGDGSDEEGDDSKGNGDCNEGAG